MQFNYTLKNTYQRILIKESLSNNIHQRIMLYNRLIVGKCLVTVNLNSVLYLGITSTELDTSVIKSLNRIFKHLHNVHTKSCYSCVIISARSSVSIPWHSNKTLVSIDNTVHDSHSARVAKLITHMRSINVPIITSIYGPCSEKSIGIGPGTDVKPFHHMIQFSEPRKM